MRQVVLHDDDAAVGELFPQLPVKPVAEEPPVKVERSLFPASPGPGEKLPKQMPQQLPAIPAEEERLAKTVAGEPQAASVLAESPLQEEPVVVPTTPGPGEKPLKEEPAVERRSRA